MYGITYGEADFIRPNRSIQDVYADGTRIGYVVTFDKGLLSPIFEMYWSEAFTEEEIDHHAKETVGYELCDTEDEGYLQFGFVVNNDDFTNEQIDSKLQAFADLAVRMLKERETPNRKED